jgi:Excreted virulence factor EspC, type VII ESX diderm
VGGSYDALMLREQQSGQQQPPPGRYSGTAVPHVNGPSYTGYTQPQNWASPAVSGRDLIVHRDVLRQVAADLARLAGQLQTTLGACGPAAALASGAAGSWPEAEQLNQAMARAHAGVTQFTAQLQQAHSDMAARLSTSADRYDAAEEQITSLIYAASDPSATIVGSGGQDTPVQPGYGQNWTPQQRAAYYRTQRLENMPGNGGPAWTGTYDITDGTGFTAGSAAGYSWQQVKSLLEATDPGAISSAGAAYGQLASTLTDVSTQLAGHGQTLAANWGGSTAVTAVGQVQQLYQTAADLQANTWSAQQALAWYGPVLSTFRASLPQPASSHPADVTAANQAAQQRMDALNSHLETAFYQMPGAVNKNLPPALAGSGGSATTGGTAGGGGSAGGGPGGSAPGRGQVGAGSAAPGGAPGLAAGPVGTLPHLGQPSPGTTLAGLVPTAPAGPGPGGAGPLAPPVAGGPAPGGGLGPLPPVLTVNPGGGPAGSGPGARGAGEPAPGEPAPGGDVPPGGLTGAEPRPSTGLPRGLMRTLGTLEEPGAAGTADGAPALTGEPGLAGEPGLTGPGSLAAQDGLAAQGEAGPALGRLPGSFSMTGAGGGGAAEADRSSQYWTTEDEATWGGGPGPAGGLDGAAADGLGWLLPGGSAPGRDQPRERARLAWLGEDDDFWGAGGPAVPPVIGG